MASVAQALRRAAQVNPQGAACITYRGPAQAPVTTTYAALHQTIAHIARALQAAAAQQQRPQQPQQPQQPRVVALLCRNHELALAYLFAAADAGWVAAPLNTRWAAPEAAAALGDCDPAVIVCDADLAPLLHAALSQINDPLLPSLRSIITLYGDEPVSGGSSSGGGRRSSPKLAPGVSMSHEAFLRRQEAGGHAPVQRPPPPRARARPGDEEENEGGDAVQCLVYTSGSTGEPKGVMLSHRAQMIQALEKVGLGQYNPNTVYLSLAPLFHVAGLNSSIAVTLAGGTHVFLQPPGGPRGLGPPTLALGAMAAHGVNTLVVVPAMLLALLDAYDKAPSDVVREAVGFVLVGGQALSEPLWRRTTAALPHARVVQSYACSEACSSISFLPLRPDEPFPAPGLVGRAAHPVEVAILALPADDNDDEGYQEGERRRRHMLLRAPGQTGEIVTRGPHIMKGYWRKPGATAAALVEEVEGDYCYGGRGPWLRTGDVGSMDAEGRLWFTGRLADVIRSGGENVMASEVERALLSHPHVAHAAVLGAPDRRLGERVVALVVLRAPVLGGEEELRRHCRGRLAGYKVPKEVRVVESLPMTASGKVMKSRLRRELLGQQGRGQEEEESRRRSFL